jgi:hypothetical protein
MLIKVAAVAGPTRTEVKELAEIFRGRIVDVAADSVIVEISGTEKKIEGFIELMRPIGILELVRTGRIAMVRGSPPTRELTEAADGGRPADAARPSRSPDPLTRFSSFIPFPFDFFTPDPGVFPCPPRSTTTPMPT